MFQIYSTSGGLFWSTAASPRARRGVRICETCLLDGLFSYPLFIYLSIKKDRALNQFEKYRQISCISRTKSINLNVSFSSYSWLCPIYWSQVLSREWRCSQSSADRRFSRYIWVINKPTKVGTYIDCLMVFLTSVGNTRDKTLVRSAYPHNGIYFTGKIFI